MISVGIGISRNGRHMHAAVPARNMMRLNLKNVVFLIMIAMNR
jgi:hypothetical protein